MRDNKLKRLQAFIAATVITAILAVCMLVVGLNAAMNPNSVPVVDISAPSNSLSAPASTTDQSQINQLTDLIKQYQDREKQYQAQLNQTNTQLKQYQSILQELQRRGLIRINADGTIQLRVRGGGD